MGVYTRSDGSWLTRRGVFLALLVGFHLLMIVGLKNGFAVRLVQQIAQPITAEIFPDITPEVPPPPLPEPALEEPSVSIPLPVMNIELPPSPAALTPPFPVASNGRPGRVVIRTKAGVAAMPKVSSFFPSSSRATGEKGTVRLRVCYDATGSVSQATVQQTSGFTALDEAAVKLGAQVRMRPATVDGKAVPACLVLPILMSPDAG